MHRSCTGIATLTLCLVAALAGSACQERTAGSGGATQGDSVPPPHQALQALVDGKTLDGAITGPQMNNAERGRLRDQVRRFYKAQNYQLVWFDGEKPSDRYRQLREVLDAANAHGLPSALYEDAIGDTSAGAVKISPDQIPQADVKTTSAFFRYFLHLTGGRLDPHALQSLWTLKPERPDLVTVLASAIQNNDLVESMERLQPSQQAYRALQKALVRYRAIAAKAAGGSWPSLPANTRLRPGQQSGVMPALRQRLAIEGDLDPAHETDSSPIYDAATVEAVKRFEERHRIKPDGIVDAETVHALNVPVQQRIRTIELNLERWRWLPDKMPARYLTVNVPDFRLEAVENDSVAWDMRVVVGAPDNKTPIFVDEMTHVVFSPYWNVPPGIASEETIPRALKDPGFISRNNMEVVNKSGEVLDPRSLDWSNTEGVRIRQKPGSGNALGGVKFIFPNTFDVYLHDTNATSLFDRIERGLSHGCVRVEEPHALARYVLRDQPEWTPEAIDAAMKAGDEKHVKLKAPIPVYILYRTAWVHDGGVRFLKDLYGHDADQAEKLWPAPATHTAAAGKLETRR